MRADLARTTGLLVLVAAVLLSPARAVAQVRLVDDLRSANAGLDALRVDEAPHSLVAGVSGCGGGPVPGILSMVMPGTGQLANGQPLKAAFFFGGFATSSILGLALAQVGPEGRPGPSNWLGLGLLGVATVLYGWGIVDAWTAPGAGGDAPPVRSVVDERRRE